MYVLAVAKVPVYAQNKYIENIKIAEDLTAKQRFLAAAQSYTAAFLSNNNLGAAEHRYSAARCWVLAGVSDSAFYQLNRSIKGNYHQFSEISTDLAFQNLTNDSRWKKVLKLVKENNKVLQKYRRYIDDAQKSSADKKYRKAAKIFTKASQYKPDYAANHYRYLCARSWVMAGEIDSSFALISRIVRNGYGDYLELSSEEDFKVLHKDKRWQKIIGEVKLNGVKNQERSTPKIDTAMARILDGILEDDQSYRFKFEDVRAKYGDDSSEMRDLENNIRNADQALNQVFFSAICEPAHHTISNWHRLK